MCEVVVGLYGFAFAIAYPKRLPKGYHTASPADSTIKKKPNVFLYPDMYILSYNKLFYHNKNIK